MELFIQQLSPAMAASLPGEMVYVASLGMETMTPAQSLAR